MLQDNIRQLIKLFDPKGVELRRARTALLLLPGAFQHLGERLSPITLGSLLLLKESIHTT